MAPHFARALVACGLGILVVGACAACSGKDGAGTGESAIGPDGKPTVPSPDGTKNGDETDVDCGGSRPEKCADGKGCKVGGDCASRVCKASVCAAPGPDDGAKNGDETDVDCGGKKAPACAVGKGCSEHGDCASDACAFDKTCVTYKGCTAKAGGATCGEGETGTAGAKHESCCATVAIPDRPAGQGGAFEIDKYLVTAGRMRAFVERFEGNLKAWAATSPKGWDDAWTSKLPGSMADIEYALGPGGKRGCDVLAQGGRTYSLGPIGGNAGEKSDFSQEVLDEKALNCVTWHMAQALCMWDGGRLATTDELAWVFENRGRSGGKTAYPWGFRDTSPYNPDVPDPRLVHRMSYQTPDPPAGMRMVNGQYPLDHAFYVAPPGRRPMAANMHGVQDAAGNLVSWASDGPNSFLSTMSWEKHNKDLQAKTWEAPGPDGYYALGARCAR